MTSKIQDKSTFHHVSQGARAFDVFEVPGLDASGEPVNVGLRIMGAFELADVIARARDFAASHGSKPKTGDPLYELARKAGTLAFVAVKADSPQQAPAPYFPGASARASRSALARLVARPVGLAGLRPCRAVRARTGDLLPACADLRRRGRVRRIATARCHQEGHEGQVSSCHTGQGSERRAACREAHTVRHGPDGDRRAQIATRG